MKKIIGKKTGKKIVIIFVDEAVKYFTDVLKKRTESKAMKAFIDASGRALRVVLKGRIGVMG